MLMINQHHVVQGLLLSDRRHGFLHLKTCPIKPHLINPALTLRIARATLPIIIHWDSDKESFPFRFLGPTLSDPVYPDGLGTSVESSVSNQPKPLSKEELDFVSHVEWFYHENKRIPTSSTLSKKFPNVNPLDIGVRAALSNRGIKLDESTNMTPLSNEQLAAIMTVTNLTDKRSKNAKLRDLGITAATWGGWLKQAPFKEFLDKLMAEAFEGNYHSIQAAISNAAESGSMDAVKLYLDLTNRTPKNQSNQIENLQAVMVRIVESIQRHVKDPAAIQAIARDFDLIIQAVAQGKTPDITPRELTI